MKTTSRIKTLLLALGGFGLLACGGQNRIEALAEALTNPIGIPEDFKSDAPFVLVPLEDETSRLVRFDLPEGIAELRVWGVDKHQLRLDFRSQPILEQDTSWDGEILALRLRGVDVPASLGEGQDQAMTMRHMLACTAEDGWHCYIEALDVLAHLGFSATDVYPRLGIDRAALGLHRIAPFADP